MSGHSKWHSIRHKKAATDSKRAKLFTQLARGITVAARSGGGDVNFNTSLRMAVEKAKSMSVPKDNIERAIKRGTGELEGAEIVGARYEGYGPGGVAFIVDALTDNTNRTVAELRHIFSKHGGNLEGSVAWQFDQQGVIVIEGEATKAQDETFMLEAIEAGADDIETEEENLIVITQPKQLGTVQKWLEKKDFSLADASLLMIPKETMPVDAAVKEQLETIIDLLEENDDVDRFFHNAEL